MNSEKAPFAAGDLVVYPTHGVGKKKKQENPSNEHQNQART